MMRRVFAGRYLPILIILMLLILPNLFEQFQSSDADAPVLLGLFLILPCDLYVGSRIFWLPLLEIKKTAEKMTL